MNDTEKAYIAGLIDGEGCIQLKKRQDGWVGVRLEICMTDVSPLLWIKEKTGIGKVYAAPEKRPNRRTPFHWYVGGMDNIKKILIEILPFLIVKKAEAMTILTYIAISKIPKEKGMRCHSCADNLCVEIMEILKKRGDAYHEAIDLCLYLRQAIEERS